MFCLSRSIYFYNVHITSDHGMAGITNSDDDWCTAANWFVSSYDIIIDMIKTLAKYDKDLAVIIWHELHS